jgi:hypothetical protein
MNILLSILMLTGATQGDQLQAAPQKPLSADYVIYSGNLDEQLAPTQADRKISISVSGKPAKDIFESIYPDIKVECITEKGERERRKGNVWCYYMPSRGYRCYLGFDLRTGKSIAGGDC